MATVKEIYTALDQWAPFSLQMDFDNAGFLVGRGDQSVEKILIALDITQDVAQEAIDCGAQVIVAHHPIIFHPAKSITDEDPIGCTLLKLIEGGVAAICAHTNLDAVPGGVNDCLAGALALSEITQLHSDGAMPDGTPYGIGRVGLAHQRGMSAGAYASYVKDRLGAASVRYVDGGRPVCKVAVGGGACASMISDVVAAGCDTFVTSDVKYDQFLSAKELGLNLMDAGHYATEQVVCPALVTFFNSRFPQLKLSLSKRHKEVYSNAE